MDAFKTAESFAKLTRMDELARQHGFCVLYPDQDVGAHALRAWNWNSAAHQARMGGEPEALAGLIEKAQVLCQTKPSKTALAGISAGGAMAASMAHLYPELIGSVALVAAPAPFTSKSNDEALREMSSGPGPLVEGRANDLAKQAGRRLGGRARRMPILIVHGLGDKSVHPSHASAQEQAGISLNAALGKRPERDPESMSLEQAEHRSGIARLWRDDEGSVVASLVVPKDLGHAWSGGDQSEPFSAGGFDQSQMLVDFFQAAQSGRWAAFEPSEIASRLWGAEPDDHAKPKPKPMSMRMRR